MLLLYLYIKKVDLWIIEISNGWRYSLYNQHPNNTMPHMRKQCIYNYDNIKCKYIYIIITSYELSNNNIKGQGYIGLTEGGMQRGDV